MMPRPAARLVPMADVLAFLTQVARPLEPQRVPLSEAVGGVLAQPLVVPSPVPREATALQAGYAVASSALVGVSSYAPLALTVELPWVEAGGILPPGADAVLPPDAVTAHGAYTEVLAEVSPGENICRPGEDAPRGAILMQEGDAFLPTHLAIARAAGLSQAVLRRPRVGIVATEEDRIDLRAAFHSAELGGDVVQLSHDEVLGRSGPPADLVIAATYDAGLVETILRNADHVAARRIALRPGEATQVASLKGVPVVAMLPRLDVLFAVSRCILQPFLRHIAGARPRATRRLGPLGRKLSSSLGLTEVALLRDAGQGVEPLGVGVFDLPALAAARFWSALPPESEGHPAGEMIDAFEI